MGIKTHISSISALAVMAFAATFVAYSYRSTGIMPAPNAEQWNNRFLPVFIRFRETQ